MSHPADTLRFLAAERLLVVADLREAILDEVAAGRRAPALAAQTLLGLDITKDAVLDDLAHDLADLRDKERDPRRFDFAPEPDEVDDANRSCFGFGREYGNDKVRYNRGPRRPAGRAY